ncbi:MAG: hypothetical protein AAGI10_01980 [Pseudomonadota bacterium]
MRRILKTISLAFALVAWAGSAVAQEAEEPLVEVELAENEVIPGQPVILRITVLVPTWLPQPVAFPTFEAPDLMVKLPESSTNATSETIDGETWSGVSRAYRLSPMVPGAIEIPAQELTIYWAEPGKTEPLVSQVVLDPFTLVGVVPEGAESLDPFLAATGLILTQEISTEARTLSAGDSLIRTITVDVDGTSPLFVPGLLPPHQIEGIASYAAEPVVTETSDRTWVSGSRVESTTLVAESGGSGTVPTVEISWFNIESGEIETAVAEGFELTVDAPVVRNLPEIAPWVIAVVVVGLAVAAVLGRWFLRSLWPRFVAWREERRAEHLASEDWAYRQLKDAIARRDYPEFSHAFYVWAARLTYPGVISSVELESAVQDLGASIYGNAHSDRADDPWRDVATALQLTRKRHLAMLKSGAHSMDQLPGLNPH